MSYEEEDTCHMRRRIQTSVYLVLCISRHTISSCVSIDTDLLLAESEGGILHLKHNLLFKDGHVQYLAYREAEEPLH